MKYLTTILLTLHCLTLGASDVRFPMRTISVTPEPVATIAVEVVDAIRADEWYMIESDGPLIVLTSPGEILEVESLTGPMTFRGRFAGGEKVETKTFSATNLYLVTAIKPGKSEVIVIPHGVTAEADVLRQVLTVSGSGPQPPPGPGPIPDPDPQPQPVVKNVSIAIIEDTMNRSPDTAILMNQLVAWTEFVDAGNDWRPYDLTTGELRGKRAITDLNGPSPGIVIYEHGTLRVLHRGLLPETFAELKALVGSLTGG